MIERTLLALAGGVVAFFTCLVGAWILISAIDVVGWQVPLAAGGAGFTSLWVVDWLTDYLAARRKT